jgi:hypothetical protein
MVRKPIQKVQAPSENEVNCKRFMKTMLGHLEAVENTFRDLANYANEHNVTKTDLYNWFIDVGYSEITANQYSGRVYRVATKAHPETKKRLANNKISFGDAEDTVKQPARKTEIEKVDTLWQSRLKASIKIAFDNGISKNRFASQLEIDWSDEERIRSVNK